MKKISIYLLGALAMGFTACDEAPEVPPMQVNEQPEILAAGDIEGAVAGVLAGTTTVALETAEAAIPVFAFTEVKDIPAGAVLKPVFELSNSADFAKVEQVKMSLSYDGETYTVSDADWNEAHIALFGKSPKVKTAYYRIPVYLEYQDAQYRYNSTDWYAVEGTVNETCKDAGFVIYDTYYFMSNSTTWSFADAKNYPFSHSAADVYDDPVFTFVLTVTQEQLDANGGGSYWKIAPPVAVDTENWGILYGTEVDGDDNLAGMLVGENAQSGKITEAGKYRLTINMEEMTYSFEKLVRPEWVAVPSNFNGWGDQGQRLYWSNKSDKPYFCGPAMVNNTDGGFKFIWDGNWYGAGSGDGMIGSGDNIRAPQDGNVLYWFTVKTDEMTYTITPITSVGVVGNLNGWSDAASIELTADASGLVYSGEVDLTDGWKIIINHSWASNYGGPLDNPVFDGGDISGYNGKYLVEFDCTGNYPVIRLTAK